MRNVKKDPGTRFGNHRLSGLVTAGRFWTASANLGTYDIIFPIRFGRPLATPRRWHGVWLGFCLVPFSGDGPSNFERYPGPSNHRFVIRSTSLASWSLAENAQNGSRWSSRPPEYRPSKRRNHKSFGPGTFVIQILSCQCLYWALRKRASRDPFVLLPCGSHPSKNAKVQNLVFHYLLATFSSSRHS